MFSNNLQMLIEASLKDGIISDKERAVLYKRAEKEGVDIKVLDSYLQSRLNNSKEKDNSQPIESIEKDLNNSVKPLETDNPEKEIISKKVEEKRSEKDQVSSDKNKTQEEVDSKEANIMFSNNLQMLIEASLKDGVITEKERAVLYKRAEKEGVDIKNIDSYLQSRLNDSNEQDKPHPIEPLDSEHNITDRKIDTDGINATNELNTNRHKVNKNADINHGNADTGKKKEKLDKEKKEIELNSETNKHKANTSKEAKNNSSCGCLIIFIAILLGILFYVFYGNDDNDVALQTYSNEEIIQSNEEQS